MSTATAVRFNLDFRPTSYFQDVDPTTLIVASILGEERRKDVQKRLATGTLDPVICGDWLTESKLDDDLRTLIGRSHPSFMGGEYLPPLADDEIEIARIVIASVMQDVTSIRARRRGNRILYRVVDEYSGKFKLSRSQSLKPLTFKELITLLNHSHLEGDEKGASGLIFSILDWNFEAPVGPEGMRDFITVNSNFYPELGAFFEHAINEYIDAQRPIEEEVN